MHGTKGQVHLQFYVEVIDRAGDKMYCPLSIAHVHVTMKMITTAPHAMHTNLHSKRTPFHMQPNKC
jgi:hypothetical protein